VPLKEIVNSQTLRKVAVGSGSFGKSYSSHCPVIRLAGNQATSIHRHISTRWARMWCWYEIYLRPTWRVRGVWVARSGKKAFLQERQGSGNVVEGQCLPSVLQQRRIKASPGLRQRSERWSGSVWRNVENESRKTWK